MSIDIKKHLKREPQIYKGIELYPILLLDMDIYDTFLGIMCIPKDYLADKEILKSSYMKYLLFYMQAIFNINDDGSNNISLNKELVKLLEYITRKSVSIKQVIDNIINDDIVFHYELYIGENKFYEYDFDKMREIILEQNGQNLRCIESYNPELEKSLKIFNTPSIKIPLKYRIFSYSVVSHTDISVMSNWTITEFAEKEIILKKYEDWKIYKPLVVSGQIEIKSPGKIDSPFDYEEESDDRYSSILMSADLFDKDLKQFTQ